MFENGGFGYVVVYLSKKTDKKVEIVIDNE